MLEMILVKADCLALIALGLAVALPAFGCGVGAAWWRLRRRLAALAESARGEHLGRRKAEHTSWYLDASKGGSRAGARA